LFRFGPTYEVGGKHVAYEGVQFPLDAMDNFMKQGVPRWATNDALTQKAYDALVQKVCPCIIVVHSQGGNFGFNAALNAPDKVKALIAVEPSGAPDPEKVKVAAVKGIPHLIVWGDYLDKNAFWQKLTVASEKYRAALSEAGGNVTVLRLPEAGLKGNTHMLMMDRNSDEVAKLVNDWIVKVGVAN
jgi:pimeloyl-ACP methyl ester carboxylesterase